MFMFIYIGVYIYIYIYVYICMYSSSTYNFYTIFGWVLYVLFYYIMSQYHFLSSGCWWWRMESPPCKSLHSKGKWGVSSPLLLAYGEKYFFSFLQVFCSDYLPDPIQVLPRIVARMGFFLLDIEGLVSQSLHPLNYYNSTLPRSA